LILTCLDCELGISANFRTEVSAFVCISSSGNCLAFAAGSCFSVLVLLVVVAVAVFVLLVVVIVYDSFCGNFSACSAGSCD
jgi:hypothetical protein